MSRPFDDEDPTPKAVKKPAAPPPKPGTKPATGKAETPPAETKSPHLAWGHVGSMTTPGRLSDGTSRPGVIRVVEANIRYDVPPLDPYIWSPAGPNLVNQYEMFWTEGNPADVHSLGDLGAELRAGNVPAPRLAVLDNVADALLDTTQRLHARDCRLGLVHPGNVLIVPGSDGRRIVLPDLGFTWSGTHGQFPWKDSPGRPKWLAEDARENPNTRYWDEEPVWQQFVSSNEDNSYQQLVSPEGDLKTLARVFATVLTGRVDRSVSAANAAPVWGVLRAVMDGKITTAEEFRARLAEHPLSEHWTAARGLGPGRGKSPLPVILLLVFLMLAGGGGLAGLYFGGFFAPNKSSDTQASNSTTSAQGTSPATTKKVGPAVKLDKVEVDWKNRPAHPPDAGAEFDDLLKQFELAKTPVEWLDLLQRMYDRYAAADEATRAKMRPWIEHLRSKYLDDWERRYRESDDAVIKNPALRYDAGQAIFGLHQELTGLRQRFEPISPTLDERELECLLISDLRSRELGSLRAP